MRSIIKIRTYDMPFTPDACKRIAYERTIDIQLLAETLKEKNQPFRRDYLSQLHFLYNQILFTRGYKERDIVMEQINKTIYQDYKAVFSFLDDGDFNYGIERNYKYNKKTARATMHPGYLFEGPVDFEYPPGHEHQDVVLAAKMEGLAILEEQINVYFKNRPVEEIKSWTELAPKPNPLMYSSPVSQIANQISETFPPECPSSSKSSFPTVSVKKFSTSDGSTCRKFGLFALATVTVVSATALTLYNVNNFTVPKS